MLRLLFFCKPPITHGGETFIYGNFTLSLSPPPIFYLRLTRGNTLSAIAGNIANVNLVALSPHLTIYFVSGIWLLLHITQSHYKFKQHGAQRASGSGWFPQNRASAEAVAFHIRDSSVHLFLSCFPRGVKSWIFPHVIATSQKHNF